MIDGLEHALEELAPEGAPALRAALEPLLGGPRGGGRLAAAERLRGDRMLRLRIERGAGPRSLLVKRLPAERAARERAAALRWLPRVGLEAHGPPLLATACERGGRGSWLVYEDLGDCALADHASDSGRVRAAVELAARLHARFTGHPLLGEARSLGTELGMAFYSASVRDAARALEALRGSGSGARARRALCERLLDRVGTLRREERERGEALEAFGGPETLLHGDLWTINVLVRPAARGYEVRLIDWERAGVGPVSYDLSAFLLRLAPERRGEVLLHYQESYPDSRRWPGRAAWNALFDTAERARIANALYWRALAAQDGEPAWGFEGLAAYEEALATLAPVLPAKPLAVVGAETAR